MSTALIKVESCHSRSLTRGDRKDDAPVLHHGAMARIGNPRGVFDAPVGSLVDTRQQELLVDALPAAPERVTNAVIRFVGSSTPPSMKLVTVSGLR